MNAVARTSVGRRGGVAGEGGVADPPALEPGTAWVARRRRYPVEPQIFKATTNRDRPPWSAS